MSTKPVVFAAMMKIARVIMALLLPVTMTFCASGNVTVHPPDAVIIQGVPFFSQEAYQCGPTALATVVNYWYRKANSSQRVTVESISSQLYSPGARGVLGIDLEQYGKKLGFCTKQQAGDIAGLKKLIDEAIPPIIFVDYGFSLYAAHHFMVVTGYCAKGFIVNSARREGQFISTEELERIWKRNDFWMLVLKPQS